MMKKWLRLIISLFTVSFIVMVALSFFSIKQYRSLTDYSNQVDHTNRLISQLYKARDIIKEIDIKERGFMITADSSYYYEFTKSITSLQSTLGALRNLVKNNREQERTLIMLQSALALRIAYFKDNISYLDTTGSAAVSPYYFKGIEKRDECVRRINEMLAKEGTQLNQTSRIKKYYEQITSSTLISLLAIFFTTTVVLFLIMVNELKKRFKYQDELQTKLQDLRRSHSELEQIAFAASHDLKEPLRKIKMFGNRLQWLKKDDMDDESSQALQRIGYATNRMQELIDDMVDLTSLIREDGNKETVDLNYTLMQVIDELEDKVGAAGATIHREVLPSINGYPRQFHILFKSLLDNSLKFRREEAAPVISIRVDTVNGSELASINHSLENKKFYRITITDNGIGFDNQFISKMFRIFQRLHNQESQYAGKGIGLAICQRIMVNHNGYILASGHPDAGATFRLFFPIT